MSEIVKLGDGYYSLGFVHKIGMQVGENKLMRLSLKTIQSCGELFNIPVKFHFLFYRW